jgi:hypothetical protein
MSLKALSVLNSPHQRLNVSFFWDTRRRSRIIEPTRSTNQSPAATVRSVEIGCFVDVRTRYLGAWTDGFEVAMHLDEGCLIRRVSDGSVLPDAFDWSDIRPASRDRSVA